MRLSVEASVAMDYYGLHETDAERQVLDSTVQELQHAVDLTTNGFRGGLTSELEVKQAETLLNQTKSQAQALDVQRAQLEHAIAVLEGKAASDFSLPRSPYDGAPPVIPSGERLVATVVLIKALGGGWRGVPANPGTKANAPAPGSTNGQPSV